LATNPAWLAIRQLYLLRKSTAAVKTIRVFSG